MQSESQLHLVQVVWSITKHSDYFERITRTAAAPRNPKSIHVEPMQLSDGCTCNVRFVSREASEAFYNEMELISSTMNGGNILWVMLWRGR